jgi:phosphoglycerol transferase
MHEALTARGRWRSLWGYVAAVLLSLAGVFFVMKLWRADLRVPLLYDTDAPYTLVWIKGIIDNSWYLHNPYLGAPFGHEHEDFPLADSLHFFILKLIAQLTSNVGLVHNAYYLLTFPLAVLASLFVLRHFQVSYLPALTASMLYAFVPGHFLRLGHLFLAAYYLLPLVVMVALWIFLGAPPFFVTSGARARVGLWNARSFAALSICLLVSSAGIYYAFFACFFLIVAGWAGTLTHRRSAPLVSASVLTLVISLGVVANLLPSILYTRRHGPNPEVAKRVAGESEFYGLKTAQLLLPNLGHRIDALAKLRGSYDQQMPLINENGYATLGLAGSLGFLLLVGRLLCPRAPSDRSELVQALAVLNVFAVLFAGIGGFSSLFGLLISPQIRGYNRISMYIAFFAMFAVALLWDQLLRRALRTRLQQAALQAGLGVLLVLGILDQTTKWFVPDYGTLKFAFRSDAAFVQAIEASVPAGGLIYQLPYMPFPEGPVREQLVNYEQCKPYLHSRALRWSHGAMKGRDGDFALRAIASRPVQEMVDAAVLTGFSGLCIDRQGYADQAADLEARLSALLEAPPLVSADRKRSFFSLLEHTQRLQHAMSIEDWHRARQQMLHSVTARFGEGFSPGPGLPEFSSRWCASRVLITLANPLPRSRRVLLNMEFAVPQPSAHLFVEGDVLSGTYSFRQGGLVISKMLLIPPGAHDLRIACDAPRLYAPGDPRFLVFQMKSFELRESD